MPMNTTIGPNQAGNSSSGASGGAIASTLNSNSAKNLPSG